MTDEPKLTLMQALEAQQLKQNIPHFAPGDTVEVQVRIKDGGKEKVKKGGKASKTGKAAAKAVSKKDEPVVKERLQAFEGIVIAIRNRGINSAFTVRKISHGEGVERVFQTHSPLIDSITIKRRGDVRKAKLYYLRDLRGKAARIKEKLNKSAATG